MRYLKIIIVSSLFVLIGCAKNKPEKYILGRWEVVNIDADRKTESNPQIFEDFKNDISYFEEVTFYEDSLVYFEYLNMQPILGTYYIEQAKFSDDFDYWIVIEHKNVNSTTHPKRFDFSQETFYIKKHTRNKLVLELVYGSSPGTPEIYDDYYLELKKTGKFE